MSTEPLENLEELARRAVACKRWRWMPGMMAIMTEPHDGETTFRVLDYIGSRETGAPITMYPDLTDPTTIDLILPLVRAAWGEAGSCHDAGPRAMWRYYSPRGQLRAEGQSRLRCLVAALEAAP
jgi:hypothetical protein